MTEAQQVAEQAEHLQRERQPAVLLIEGEFVIEGAQFPENADDRTAMGIAPNAASVQNFVVVAKSVFGGPVDLNSVRQDEKFNQHQVVYAAADPVLDQKQYGSLVLR